METKNSGKLVFYAILIVLSLFGLLRIFVYKSGLFFGLELFGFIVLLLLALISFIAYKSKWGERVLFFIFLFYIINLILIWVFKGDLYIILFLIALIGFLMAIPKREEHFEFLPPEPHSVVFDNPEPKKEAVVKQPTRKVNTTYSPGKFVASKQSNIYHAPKCEWAKKIKKERRIWFKSKSEAWEKGYKAHNCVK